MPLDKMAEAADTAIARLAYRAAVALASALCLYYIRTADGKLETLSNDMNRITRSWEVGQAQDAGAVAILNSRIEEANRRISALESRR